MAIRNENVIVIGDSVVGKSRLYYTYAGIEPTPCYCNGERVDNLMTAYGETFNFYHNNIPTTLKYSEVSCRGSGDSGTWNDLRSKGFYYNGGTKILIVYSTIKKETLVRAEHFWYPEITKFCPGVPIILVGTKVDIRASQEESTEEGVKERHVSRKEGEKVAELLGVDFIECNTLSKSDCNNVIDRVLNGPRPFSSEAKKKHKHEPCFLM